MRRSNSCFCKRFRGLPALLLAWLLVLPMAAAGCRSARVAGDASTAHTPTATPLREVGERLERRLAPGERQSFTLDLEADRFVHLVIAERGADVVATLTSPSGEVLATADGPGEGRAQELLAAVTRETGRHRVDVELRPGAAAGDYQLRYLDLRSAEPTDGELIEGMRAYLEGKALDTWDPLPERRERALAAYELAARHFEAVGNENYLAWTLFRAAALHFEAGRWLEAERSSRRAGEIFASLDESDGGLASTLTQLARALVQQGRYEEATETFDRAFAVVTDLQGRALNLNNRADLFLRLDRISEAKKDLQEALRLWRQASSEGLAGTESEQVTVLINLGVAQRRSGELVEAFHSYEEAAALAAVHGDRRHRVLLASNLGSYYIVTGDYQRALDTLVFGLEAARELGDTIGERAIVGKLGLVYQRLGQTEVARRYYEQSLELARAQGDPRRLADSLRLLGRLGFQTGELGEARELLEAALELSRDATPLAQAASLRDLAELAISEGNPAEGLELIEQARRLDLPDDQLLTASLLYNEAAALERLGRTTEARRVLEAALDPMLMLDNPLRLGSMYALLGTLDRAQGDLDSALAHLSKAMELHELMRSRVADPYQRATFSANRYAHFQSSIDLMMELEAARPGDGYAQRAFQTSERLRARSLVELLSETRVDVRRKVDPELRRREEELSLRVALLQNELLQTGSDEAQTAGKADSDKLRRALELARGDQRLLATEIRGSSSAYASLRYPEPLALQEIQRRLPPGEALLHYSLGAERSFLFVVRRGAFDWFEIAPAPEIEAGVESLRTALASDDPRSLRRVSAAGRDLFERVLSPVEPLLKTMQRLWIVPDGALFRLPFEVLDTGRGPLIDRTTVSYLPSANVIDLLPRSAAGKHGDRFVAFAGVTGEPTAPPSPLRDELLRPLPGTVDEVKAIARLLPDRSTLYLGPDAHQGNLFDNPEVTHAHWLHFASHALVLDDGADSVILLSPDANGDRFLQVSEVFNLELNADVVVLSACETALGETLRGDGMIGLARAFFYAGTPNLVVSLWPVDDRATALLMEAFYRHLARGLAPADSLRQAKLDLIRTTSYRSPRFWAPFVLLGAPRGADVTAAAVQTPVVASAIRTIELKEGER